MIKINVGIDTTKTYVYILLSATFFLLVSLTPIYQTVVDVGPGVTHQNHEDTITTPLPGNCPNCDYPDCGGCGGQPQITLMPTEVIPTIPPFLDPATPDIPDPTQYPTVFPTFGVGDLLPTALSTRIIPTIAPTVVSPGFGPTPVPVGD